MDSYEIKKRIFSGLIKTKNIFSNNFSDYLFNNPILLHYSDFSTNWGDYINPYLISKVSNKKVVSSKRIFNVKNNIPRLFGVGSILNTNLKNSIIWGSGYIQYPSVWHDYKPKEVLALRGKLTEKALNDHGVTTPGIYGDPALIFPELYQPTNVTKKYKLGLIPHYSELPMFQNNKDILENSEILIISPWVENDMIFDIIDKIAQCENIISSSLHGIILADAYKIPSARFTLSNQIIGGDYKYDDYYSGVGINDYKTISFNSVSEISNFNFFDKVYLKEIRFNSKKLKDSLYYAIDKYYS